MYLPIDTITPNDILNEKYTRSKTMRSIHGSVMGSSRRSQVPLSDLSLSQISIKDSESPENEEKSIELGVNQISENAFINRPNTMKFPPLVRKPLLPLLDIKDLSLDSSLFNDISISSTASNKWKRESVNSSDINASARVLKNALQEIVEKVMDNRQLVRDIGDYVISLHPPLPSDITVSSIIEGIQQLDHYRNEANEYILELNALKNFRIQEAFSGYEASSSKVYFQSLLSALTKLADDTLKEAELTSGMTSNLIDILFELKSLPEGINCLVDGIQADFNSVPYELKIETSKRCRAYVKFNLERSLRIIPAVYTFLQSSTSFGSVLNLSNWSFTIQELGLFITFFTEYKLCHLIKSFILDNCALGDRGIHALSSKMLSKCSMLSMLSLRGNNITTSGAISLSICMWDGGLFTLTILRLDSNVIKPDGVKLLSAALNRCRYLTSISIGDNPIGDWGVYYIMKSLLNQHRWLYPKYPRPSKIQYISLDDPNLDIPTHRLKRLPWSYYPPRDITEPVLSSSTKFSFAVHNKINSDFPWLNSNESASNKEKNTDDNNNDDEENKAEKQTYDDNDEIDDDEALMTVTSRYSNNDSFKGQSKVERDESDFKKMPLLYLFRSSKSRNATASIIGETPQSRSLKTRDISEETIGLDDDISDDEFSMSEKDPYSSSGEDESEDEEEDISNAITSNVVPFQSFSNTSTGRSISSHIKSKNSKRLKDVSKLGGQLTSIQKLFVKVQYKLFAVIAFNQLRRPGLQVTSVNFRNCQLSPVSSLLLRMALVDNISLTDLDISDNPDIFTMNKVLFQGVASANPLSMDELISNHGGVSHRLQALGDTIHQFYVILTATKLRHIKMNNTGLSEADMEKLCQGMTKSSSLQSIDLSDNKLGPTALNWITTALSQFSIDVLDMTSGFNKPQGIEKFTEDEEIGFYFEEAAKLQSSTVKSASPRKVHVKQEDEKRVKKNSATESTEVRRFRVDLFGKRYAKMMKEYEDQELSKQEALKQEAEQSEVEEQE